MLKKIETFVREKIPLARFFLKKHHNGFSKGLCAISISSNEICILSTGVHSGKMQIDLCKRYPYDHPENLKSVLNGLVRENQLRMKPCIWVLQPEDYQLLLTDALPVTEAEFSAAIRWKIKDLITMPLDDIVIDHFPVPSSGADSSKKIMVVVARSSYLEKISHKIEDSDLNLEIIDVPELCFRNVNALYEHDEKPIAMVYVQENIIQLIITRQEQLYFSRRLTSKLTADKRLDVERMSVEIQRSFDYFANQWRLKAPEQIVLVATTPIDEEETHQLAQKMNASIELIDIMKTIGSSLDLSLWEQGKYLALIGCLLKVVPKEGILSGLPQAIKSTEASAL